VERAKTLSSVSKNLSNAELQAVAFKILPHLGRTRAIDAELEDLWVPSNKEVIRLALFSEAYDQAFVETMSSRGGTNITIGWHDDECGQRVDLTPAVFDNAIGRLIHERTELLTRPINGH
jgi:hypothetical protein